ncbi:uncharacterized protein BKA55DRAFT_542496 [Fusarium redolens]|uniref:NACHT-NTPase and P-loop NTPases N-terminal domain-containing protein n=1 Tax=Fusarium redolens TaxID=48865 RepID=A0A9P9GIV6_FUSRE|nr:uncharacterized protein BKA55DRAFT_542496 [Fusarium redolens]KAH7239896.1 hypothetical protein BKA55DRAFT_542496 [Fusarium redolens]
MAEEFAALLIATNIAQFTEYALALISYCREIYESVDGAKQENLELETVIQSIQDRHNCMKATCRGSSGQAPPKRTLKLIESCEPYINSLISTLGKIKATKKSRFPKLGSLRATIVASCNFNTLRGLKKRLLVIEEKIESNNRGFAEVVSNVEELVKEAEEVVRDQRFLDSLSFEDLKEREYRIKDASVTTLAWIFLLK